MLKICFKTILKLFEPSHYKCQNTAIGNDIAIILESFNKNSIDGAVNALLAELACGGL